MRVTRRTRRPSHHLSFAGDSAAVHRLDHQVGVLHQAAVHTSLNSDPTKPTVFALPLYQTSREGKTKTQADTSAGHTIRNFQALCPYMRLFPDEVEWNLQNNCCLSNYFPKGLSRLSFRLNALQVD